MPKAHIYRLVIIGDSLTDRGQMAHSKLFGFIPMGKLSGLTGKSPLGRFTNGLTWADDLLRQYAEEFIMDILLTKGIHKQAIIEAIREENTDFFLKHLQQLEAEAQQEVEFIQAVDQHKQRLKVATKALKEKGIGEERIKLILQNAYAILQDEEHELAQLPGVRDIIHESFTLDDYRYVSLLGHPWARSYAIGGMTSADWSESLAHLEIEHPIDSVKALGARHTVSTLGEMRHDMLAYDREQGVDAQAKEKTLVYEWSGANDLITVNLRPTNQEADAAVKARVANVDALYQQGYRHVILFNLPDLSLTPRYQKESHEEQVRIRQVCLHFNRQLQRQIGQLRQRYPKLNIHVFDAFGAFNQIYHHPQKFGFDPSLKKTAYTQSGHDFEDVANAPHSEKYMWWNDVHPSARMQAELCKKAKAFTQRHFKVTSPVKEITAAELHMEEFLEKYEALWEKQVNSCFGFLRSKRLNTEHLSLKYIFDHALYGGGGRTKSVIQDLGWIDSSGRLKSNDEHLRQAYMEAQEEACERIEDALLDTGLL